MSEYKSALINALRQSSSGNNGISFFGPPERVGSSLTIKNNYGGANDPSVLEMVANTPYTVEYGKQLGVKSNPKDPAVNAAAQSSSSSSSWRQQEPSAWDQMSSSEKAAWYRENPTMSKVTQTLQDLWGMTSLGMLQNAIDPEGVYNHQAIARGFDPEEGWAATNNFEQSITSGGQPPAPAPEPAPEPTFADYYDVYTPTSDQGWSSTYSAPESSSYYSGDGSNSDYSGGGYSDSSGGYGSWSSYGGYAKGGKVTKDRLIGPDPKGPDDGFAALDAGEFVITKDAAQKLGPEVIDLLQRLNSKDKKEFKR